MNAEIVRKFLRPPSFERGVTLAELNTDLILTWEIPKMEKPKTQNTKKMKILNLNIDPEDLLIAAIWTTSVTIILITWGLL